MGYADETALAGPRQAGMVLYAGIISCFSWNRNKGGHTAHFDLLYYLQFVPGPYGALLEHLYEYALPGHDAVPCRLAYGAVIMALLAYLGNLAYGIWA